MIDSKKMKVIRTILIYGAETEDKQKFYNRFGKFLTYYPNASLNQLETYSKLVSNGINDQKMEKVFQLMDEGYDINQVYYIMLGYNAFTDKSLVDIYNNKALNYKQMKVIFNALISGISANKNIGLLKELADPAIPEKSMRNILDFSDKFNTLTEIKKYMDVYDDESDLIMCKGILIKQDLEYIVSLLNDKYVSSCKIYNVIIQYLKEPTADIGELKRILKMDIFNFMSSKQLKLILKNPGIKEEEIAILINYNYKQMKVIIENDINIHSDYFIKNFHPSVPSEIMEMICKLQRKNIDDQTKTEITDIILGNQMDENQAAVIISSIDSFSIDKIREYLI